MSKYTSRFIQLSDLYLAYRKAKVDVFYDRTHPSALAFSKYEKSLDFNLKKLLKMLTDSQSDVWYTNISYLGGFSYVPKSLNEFSSESNIKTYYRAIDPNEDWIRKFKNNGLLKSNAKYRLIIDATVNFHIISALWIIKVGDKYEMKLNQELSYGNRLRRFNASPFMPQGSNGDLNLDTMGLFQPYFSAYKKWREDGLKAMISALKENKEIHAITMDIASFYHNVSPKFIFEKKFLDELGITLNEDEVVFTNELLLAMDYWYSMTPDYNDRKEGAIPVGLSSSKVISNILLYQLDKEMSEKLQPIYYGRYVDDIFLVIDAPKETSNGDDIIQWISQNIDCLKLINGLLTVNFEYANDSNLIFAQDKQKIFYLNSEHGLDLVNQIFSQIRKQSSEYRLLPDVPETVHTMATRALLSTSDASLEADALRKTDVVSIRRLGFSLLLSDVEAYSKNLMPNSWYKIRKEFYTLVYRYLFSPNGIFNFTGYFYRIFSLMISSNDFNDAYIFIEKLKATFKLLEETTTDDTVSEEKFKKCKSYFIKNLTESALKASTVKKFNSWTDLGRLLRSLFIINNNETKIHSHSDSLKIKSRELLLSDLGNRPYKEYWYYSQENNIDEIKIPKSRSVQKILRLASIRLFSKVSRLKQPHWPALAFPTRPLTIQEIAIINPNLLEDEKLFKRALFGFRGARVQDFIPIGFKTYDDNKILEVPIKERKNVKVAVTSFETTENQWIKSFSGKPDRSISRYKNINSLVNQIIKNNTDIDYLTFPECSIPRRWAFSMANKLSKNGISLICGLEYYSLTPTSKKIIRNDSLVSLFTKWPGYRSNIIYIQQKLKPAHDEKDNIAHFSKKTKRLDIPKKSPYNLPIFKHGNYYFGILICSDMTNIHNRTHFQGKIDTLFTLEWNPDVKTFNFLVESAAHDLHTFIIQVNNRKYGDSRIRAPYKEDYKRDLIQVKGGISDFYVVGKIDFISLRKFQNAKRKLKKPLFKPLPIDYGIASWRKNNS
ncbi:RNA-directed DNA polymerase [Aliarcobacter cryaerophilus]|uniref:RNA-directed DNA polymerase n=1 Tax=Aliarcobacter cryaerophilus TaxID=28198 RepID=UPI0021B3FDEE|nr:RNA-directed DNA polymerase [Aliarcobacter cryaerophilus]MCT7480374.1 RNA-directed DNA polymerase [Aliarcobacter cryaerophilus]MCT7484746.1 RNA-directed DNA polymerase [Aliarcobacter cryaerophilus]